MPESDESDIDSKEAAPPKKMQKPSQRPTDDAMKHGKKLTTKLMIIDALKELHTRKGVSLYAIKKYLQEKHQTNTERLNFMIKKTLKLGVEDGTFVQLKGIGASGSFKLGDKKDAKPKNKKETAKREKEPKKKIEKDDKSTKKLPEKKAVPKTKQKVTDNLEIKAKKKPKGGQEKTAKKIKEKQKPEEAKKKKSKSVVVEKKEKKTKVKMLKAKENMATPAKKRATMIKRKSIGSIIKPPKMKPKKQ